MESIYRNKMKELKLKRVKKIEIGRKMKDSIF